MKKSTRRLIAIIFSCAAVSTTKELRASNKYKRPAYGMGGCGPGSVIFGGKFDRNATGSQMMAASTNSSSGYTYLAAITSATSNCTDTPAGSEEAFRIERETYVSMNLGDLSKEASQGEGNHLRGLAEMIGCGNDSQFEVFAAVAQTEHDVIFSDTVASNVANRFVAKAKETDALQSCLRNK
jgi:hypothetical protein